MSFRPEYIIILFTVVWITFIRSSLVVIFGTLCHVSDDPPCRQARPPVLCVPVFQRLVPGETCTETDLGSVQTADQVWKNVWCPPWISWKVTELQLNQTSSVFRQSRLESLDLNIPPPGLASFQDLYSALLTQYEAVSFGDRLFGCWVLLPLQRRYSTTMRLAVFGEHVGMLRSLGVTLEQVMVEKVQVFLIMWWSLDSFIISLFLHAKLAVPIERFTSPPEDSLPLLRLYFRSLVTGTLTHHWCPVLYVVALSHINSFIFSQDAAAQVAYSNTHTQTSRVSAKSMKKVMKNTFILLWLKVT